jgi:hypothetical protein
MARPKTESLEQYEYRLSRMPDVEVLHELKEAQRIYPRPPIGEFTIHEILLGNQIAKEKKRR